MPDEEAEKPPPSDGSDAAGGVREGQQSGMKKPDGSLSGKRKRWWDVWKRWKEGEESDWWFASTGIP